MLHDWRRLFIQLPTRIVSIQPSLPIYPYTHVIHVIADLASSSPEPKTSTICVLSHYAKTLTGTYTSAGSPSGLITASLVLARRMSDRSQQACYLAASIVKASNSLRRSSLRCRHDDETFESTECDNGGKIGWSFRRFPYRCD